MHKIMSSEDHFGEKIIYTSCGVDHSGTIIERRWHRWLWWSL